MYYVYMVINIRNGVKASILGINLFKFYSISQRKRRHLLIAILFGLFNTWAFLSFSKQFDIHNWLNSLLIFISITSWRLLTRISLVSPFMRPIHVSVLHFVADGISLDEFALIRCLHDNPILGSFAVPCFLGQDTLSFYAYSLHMITIH